MEQAVDLLRKKGLAKAAKKSGRIAAEGLIGVAVEALKGVVVEVNSETDFVARNELFQGLVKMIANVALTVGPDAGEDQGGQSRRASPWTKPSPTPSPRSARTCRCAGRRRCRLAKGSSAATSTMPWTRASERSASSWRSSSNGSSEELERLGRMVAMHVAASNPQAIDPLGSRPRCGPAREGGARRQVQGTGQAANVIDKIVESGLKTFYKEVCLLDQAFIHDPDKTVSQALKEAESKAGAPIKVTGFVRYALGEGIDRPDSDLGGEVASLLKPN